ncbi:MAG: DNA/RNA nuclease SfsA [Ferrovum sp.]|jgi:sugar fermentation stimulation protein A|nr:DNA/RNA nuclease SfsA [Ferrovum sp.]NDU87142.1 DNA/RNA nuclease SfsA [Ferrovum sp.]
MFYPEPLIEGVLQRRYQRFLADIDVPDEGTVVAHVPNTGSLLGCLMPGQRARLSRSSDPARRCKFTVEQLQVGEVWVGVNTQRANALVGEALSQGWISRLADYPQRRPEVPYGRQKSRIDWLLQAPGSADCFVEVKSVTTSLGGLGRGIFPDAPSQRALKHLEELIDCVHQGSRGVLVFCVQRADIVEVCPADEIDPAYGAKLRHALAQGVEALAFNTHLSATEIRLNGQLLPIYCP